MYKGQDGYGTRVWRILYPLLTYYGVYYLAFILAGILGMTFSVIALEQSGGLTDYYVLLDQTTAWVTIHQYEVQIATNLMMLPLAILYAWSDQKRREGQAALFREKAEQGSRIRAGLIVSVFLGIFASMALNGLLYLSRLTSLYAENLGSVGDALYQGNIPMEILGMGILAPIVEEMVFRGLIFRRLKEWVSPAIAIVTSGILFGLYHGNLLQTLYAAAIGILFAWVYEKYRTLTAPVLAHIGANLFSLAATESGMLDSILTDDIWLIIFTAVSCLLLAGCLYLIQEKGLGAE